MRGNNTKIENLNNDISELKTEYGINILRLENKLLNKLVALYEKQDQHPDIHNHYGNGGGITTSTAIGGA